MRFVHDENFSVRLGRALNELGTNGSRPLYEMIALVDHFPRGTKDPEWLKGLPGKVGKDVVVVSGDVAALRDHANDIAKCGLCFYFLWNAFPRTSIWEQAKAAVGVWPKILNHAAKADAVPHLVQANGKISVEAVRRRKRKR